MSEEQTKLIKHPKKIFFPTGFLDCVKPGGTPRKQPYKVVSFSMLIVCGCHGDVMQVSSESLPPKGKKTEL